MLNISLRLQMQGVDLPSFNGRGCRSFYSRMRLFNADVKLDNNCF